MSITCIIIQSIIDKLLHPSVKQKLTAFQEPEHILFLVIRINEQDSEKSYMSSLLRKNGYRGHEF